MAAAAELFLRNGYQGTSMDEVAALAAVSKQTVYKNFADKERLFNDIVMGVAGTVEEFLQSVADTLRDTDDFGKDLHTLGRQYIKLVMRPQVLQMRRLLIGESAPSVRRLVLFDITVQFIVFPNLWPLLI